MLLFRCTLSQECLVILHLVGLQYFLHISSAYCSITSFQYIYFLFVIFQLGLSPINGSGSLRRREILIFFAHLQLGFSLYNASLYSRYLIKCFLASVIKSVISSYIKFKYFKQPPLPPFCPWHTEHVNLYCCSQTAVDDK